MTRTISRVLLTTALALGLGAGSASALTIFSDNFDSYAPGSRLEGQGGWFQVPVPGFGTQINPLIATSSFTLPDGTTQTGPMLCGSCQTTAGTIKSGSAHAITLSAISTGVVTLSVMARAFTAGADSSNSTVGFLQAGSLVDVSHAGSSIEWLYQGAVVSAGVGYSFGVFGTVVPIPSPNQVDRDVQLGIVLDFTNLQVFGTMRSVVFGGGVNTTAPVSVTLSQLQSLAGVAFGDVSNFASRGVEFDNLSVTAVPEPGMLLLLGSGVLGLGVFGRRRSV